jgi:hypothetical protein
MRGAFEDGWRAPDFAVERITHAWFVARCPNPHETTPEAMAALRAEFEREHADLLAAHEPRAQRFRTDHERLVAPFRARVRGHLVQALRDDAAGP